MRLFFTILKTSATLPEFVVKNDVANELSYSYDFATSLYSNYVMTAFEGSNLTLSNVARLPCIDLR